MMSQEAAIFVHDFLEQLILAVDAEWHRYEVKDLEIEHELGGEG